MWLESFSKKELEIRYQILLQCQRCAISSYGLF